VTLASAVHASVSGLDLSFVGWILMVAGLVGITVGALSLSRSRQDAVVTDRRLPLPHRRAPGIAADIELASTLSMSGSLQVRGTTAHASAFWRGVSVRDGAVVEPGGVK
jgi:hypothetical protein